MNIKNKLKDKLKDKIVKTSSRSKVKNEKNDNNNNYNNDLLMLLNEADHITLDDFEFDNILKEQSQILCNINNILNRALGRNISQNNLNGSILCSLIYLIFAVDNNTLIDNLNVNLNNNPSQIQNTLFTFIDTINEADELKYIIKYAFDVINNIPNNIISFIYLTALRL